MAFTLGGVVGLLVFLVVRSFCWVDRGWRGWRGVFGV